jgi:hypothetical protein
MTLASFMSYGGIHFMTKLSVEKDMQSCLVLIFPFLFFIVIKIWGGHSYTCVCVCVYIYIYIYIYPLSFAMPFFLSQKDILNVINNISFTVKLLLKRNSYSHSTGFICVFQMCMNGGYVEKYNSFLMCFERIL